MWRPSRRLTKNLLGWVRIEIWLILGLYDRAGAKIREQFGSSTEQQPEMLAMLADIEERRSNLHAAVQLLKKAIELKPDAAETHWQLALVYEKLNQRDFELHELEAALRNGGEFGAPFRQRLQERITKLLADKQATVEE